MVKDITIKARNAAGLFGQSSRAEIDGITEFSTKAASRHRQLKQQLQMALAIAENEPHTKYIDTMFLQVDAVLMV